MLYDMTDHAMSGLESAEMMVRCSQRYSFTAEKSARAYMYKQFRIPLVPNLEFSCIETKKWSDDEWLEESMQILLSRFGEFVRAKSRMLPCLWVGWSMSCTRLLSTRHDQTMRNMCLGVKSGPIHIRCIQIAYEKNIWVFQTLWIYMIK